MVEQSSHIKGTARRIRRRSENSPARSGVVMNVVECGNCGERFEISHQASCQDPQLAQRQAAWLQDQFVWDHIQENRHRGLINLPEADQIK
ncbi:MAG TPA: hypothetical protein VN669_13435 [Candidatus Acidoferrales bacterium]|nr:hypothetical protein [Candidatus Acidoferrales bacterium]